MIRKIFQSSLAKDVGIYTITNIINASIPFLLLPVLTRYMSPSDYGIVAMFTVLIAFVSPFTGLNVVGAIQRQFYENEKINLPVYVTNCLLVLICSSALVFLVFYFFADQISAVSSFPKRWLWAVVAIAIAQFITLINLSLWQMQLKARMFGFYQIVQTAMNIGLSVLFVVGLGMAWQGRIQAQLLTMITFGLLSLFILYKSGWINCSFRKPYIQNALKFGVPLVPHVLGGVMLTMTDRFFITNMVGIEATGLYAVGYQLGMVIGLFGESFNRAYVPWLFDKLKQNHHSAKIMIVKTTYAYFFFIVIFAIGLSFLAPRFLSFFVGEKFTSASVYVFWIALAYAFSCMYKMVVNYIFYIQKTYILAWVTFFCAVINVPLNYVLITWNGSVGGAQAHALTFFIFFLMTWTLSSRVYKMPWLSVFFFRHEA